MAIEDSIVVHVNKAFAEDTGEKVNRGAGYGLEIPCVYIVYGPKTYVTRRSVEHGTRALTAPD